jgi:NAD(P)-dependent dehydrogenase (short-subunit alcohol dehydrogenase family)
LILNAGTGGVKTVEEADDDFYEWVFATNYFGSVKVTKSFLPYMRKRGSGTFVFISSRNADIGMLALSAYAPSKAALAGAWTSPFVAMPAS